VNAQLPTHDRRHRFQRTSFQHGLSPLSRRRRDRGTGRLSPQHLARARKPPLAPHHHAISVLYPGASPFAYLILGAGIAILVAGLVVLARVLLS